MGLAPKHIDHLREATKHLSRDPAAVRLTGVYHNLLRQWVEM